MILIYSHRYMTSISEMEEISVFSVMQSDIIYYGFNLISYFEIEFGIYRFLEWFVIKIIYWFMIR